MRVSTHRKSQLIGYADQLCGFGLKVGVPVLVVSAVFLVVAALGAHIREMAKMSEADRAYLVQSVGVAIKALTYAGVAVVASLVYRLHRDEATGQFLSIVGVVLCLGSPALFASVADSSLSGNPLFESIVKSFCTLGTICLVPGLVLLLRDAILRIWTGVSVKRVMERRWGDEEDRQKKHRIFKVYGSCWDMAFCREFVRKVCPAFQAKKSCWRVKTGCYCDEKTILRAMMSNGADNSYARGIMDSLGLDKPEASRVSNKLRRERCRRCGIYAEHQRQKYRLLSPLAFPLVGVLLYGFYGTIVQWVWVALAKADRFMSFLTYRPGDAAYSFADDGRILTTLAIVWLSIMAVSYLLRALEYLVFELQV